MNKKSIQKIRFIIILVLTFLIILMVGFVVLYSIKMLESISSKNEDEGKRRLYHVIITGTYPNATFLRQVCEGAQKNDHNSVIELYVPSSWAEDVSLQEQLDYASFVGADGIIAWIDDIDSVKSEPITADGREIPMVTLGTYVDSVKQISYIGAGNFEVGRKLGNEVINTLNGKGNVLVIAGKDQNELSYSLMMNGMQNTLQSYTNIHVSYLDVLETEELTADDYIRQQLSLVTGIDVIVCLSEKETYRVIQSVIDLDKAGSFKVIGFQEDEATLEYLQKGIATVLLSLNPQKIGVMAMDQLADYRNSGYANEVINTDISVRRGIIEK